MAAVIRLQRLTNTSLQNLIHRNLLSPIATSFAAAATAFVKPFNISPESQHAKDFIMSWNLPIGISELRAFDLSIMEARGRSSSKNSTPVLEEDVEDDDEDEDFDDLLEESGRIESEDDDDEDDDDDYGRGRGGGGGSRGGAAYTA